MAHQEHYKAFTPEQQIIHQLLLRSGVDPNIGLYDGKMGLILFFKHYFVQTNHPVYEDTADELLDELMEEVHRRLPIDFASGLSGIGWGIEYLIQHGWVDGDSLEVCEEIDQKIMEQDPRRMTDYSLETGLEGILHYVLAHIQGVMLQHAILPFDEIYLNDLYQAVSKISPDSGRSDHLNRLSRQYADFYRNKTKIVYPMQLSLAVSECDIEPDRLKTYPLGLNKGLAGFLLKNKTA